MPQISVPRDFFRPARDTFYAIGTVPSGASSFQTLDVGAKAIKIRTRFTDKQAKAETLDCCMLPGQGYVVI